MPSHPERVRRSYEAPAAVRVRVGLPRLRWRLLNATATEQANNDLANPYWDHLRRRARLNLTRWHWLKHVAIRISCFSSVTYAMVIIDPSILRCECGWEPF